MRNFILINICFYTFCIFFHSSILLSGYSDEEDAEITHLTQQMGKMPTPQIPSFQPPRPQSTTPDHPNQFRSRENQPAYVDTLFKDLSQPAEDSFSSKRSYVRSQQEQREHPFSIAPTVATFSLGTDDKSLPLSRRSTRHFLKARRHPASHTSQQTSPMPTFSFNLSS